MCNEFLEKRERKKGEKSSPKTEKDMDKSIEFSVKT